MNLSEDELYPNKMYYMAYRGPQKSLKITQNSDSQHPTFQRRIKNSKDRF